MNEKLEQNEFVQEIPLDINFFERVDNFSPPIADKKKLEFFRKCIVDSKTKAFSYTEEILDYFLHSPSSPKGMDENEKEYFDSVPDHGIANLINIISEAFQIVGVKPSWIKDSPRKVVSLMEAAALNYVFRKSLDYQKAVKEEQLKPEEALAKLALASVIKPEYIETKILKKLSELPESVRENLFKINQ